jgi:hypothetical protein
MSLETADVVVDTDGPPPAGLGKGGTVTQVPPGSFGLYLCLGPSVHPVEEAAAGNVLISVSEYIIHCYSCLIHYFFTCLIIYSLHLNSSCFI